jgi:hypothetical protein
MLCFYIFINFKIFNFLLIFKNCYFSKNSILQKLNFLRFPFYSEKIKASNSLCLMLVNYIKFNKLNISSFLKWGVGIKYGKSLIAFCHVEQRLHFIYETCVIVDKFFQKCWVGYLSFYWLLLTLSFLNLRLCPLLQLIQLQVLIILLKTLALSDFGELRLFFYNGVGMRILVKFCDSWVLLDFFLEHFTFQLLGLHWLVKYIAVYFLAVIFAGFYGNILGAGVLTTIGAQHAI